MALHGALWWLLLVGMASGNLASYDGALWPAMHKAGNMKRWKRMTSQQQRRTIVAIVLAATMLAGVVVGCCGCSATAVIISYVGG